MLENIIFIFRELFGNPLKTQDFTPKLTSLYEEILDKKEEEKPNMVL